MGGFTETKWQAIAQKIAQIKPYSKLVLFGSRAKGNWKEGSDVDLAVWGSGWDELVAEHVKEEVEDAFFPWSFDVVVVDTIKEQALREHIERVGEELTAFGLG